jgi:MerR family transcriptional regulator, light-induced transcriptional regulator
MSTGPPAPALGRLARRVLAIKNEVARDVTDDFFRRHPEWIDRFGDEGRRRGVEDAVFHQEFLAGALRLDDPDAFRRYVRWTAGVLDARGISPRFLAENLDQIRTTLSRRIPDDEDRSRLDAFLHTGISEAERYRSRDAGPLADLEDTAEVYLRALLAGSRQAATGAMDEALKQGWTVPDLYLKVIQVAQYRLGELWMANRISVAQEHMASAITQRVLAHLYPHLPHPDRPRGVAVITGVEGELHQIGAHMVSDILEADGWDVRFLGTQLPHRDIVDRVRDEAPALVGISATMLFNLSAVADLIQRLRELDSAASIRILVGGSAFRQSEGAWREVGADAFAPDLLVARETARSLTSAQDR